MFALFYLLNFPDVHLFGCGVIVEHTDVIVEHTHLQWQILSIPALGKSWWVCSVEKVYYLMTGLFKEAELRGYPSAINF